MTDQKKQVTKEQAATAQLDAAIKLYFENRNLISAHTLVSAAAGVIDGVYKGNRDNILFRQFLGASNPGDVNLQFSFGEELGFRIVPGKEREFVKYMNASQNFFKHADRDPNAIHEFNEWEECGIKIFLAIRDYHLVYQRISPAMEVFEKIYLVLHPNMLVEGSDVRNLIEGLRDKLGLGKDWELTRAQMAFAGLHNLRDACPEMFSEPDINCIVR